MPYKKKKDGNLVNEVTIGDGYPLSSNLQPLKVGGEVSPIEVASAYPDGSINAKVKIIGDLEVTGSILPVTVFPDETGDIEQVGIYTDSGNLIFNSGNALFYISGGEGIDTEYDASSGYIYIKGEDASTSNKGVASFNSTNFSVSSGAVDTVQGISTSATPTFAGQTVNGPTLTDAGTDDTLLVIRQILNDTSAAGSTQEYRMIKASLTETDVSGWDAVYLIDLMDGSGNSKFNVRNNGDATFAGNITSGSAGTISSSGGTVQTTNLTSKNASLTGDTLTTADSDDKLLNMTQTLNFDMSGLGTQEYRMIKTNLTDTASGGWDNVYLIDQQVGGTSKFNVKKDGSATFGGTVTANNVLLGRFQVQGQYHVYGRYSSVNTWYVGNNNFGTSITEGDWAGGFKMNYAQFTAVSNVKLIGWKFHGSFSSSVDWEMELWHTETPADGESDPEEATKIGSTQSVSATSTRLYTLGETGLTYSIPAGDQIYLLTRYTSGSSTKYSYGTVGFEFSY